MKKSGGRFRKQLHPVALKFSSSLNFDRELYAEDIQGSIAHAEMLAKQKIITSSESRKIQARLNVIRKEIESGRFSFIATPGKSDRFATDDIHMAIEQRLIEKIGDVGGKLHTARSRNDQIALDERLYLRKQILTISSLIKSLQSSLVKKAERYIGVIMPGYTHLQRAQPILLAHHLLAYVSMLEGDRERLGDCQKRAELSPLGAGALAGTSFPIDRRFVAKRLNFRGVIENSIDAVSDRDVQIEFLSACAVIMMHLSRFGEEVVLWNSDEWQFIEIADDFSTGSSIMPQKKNPDIAELVRGKTGRVYGNLFALLTIMKGLPLAYNRDMQEDKPAIFDAASTVSQSVRIFDLMFRSAKFNRTRFIEDLDGNPLLATELADYLVRKGLPFRKAHDITGGIVRKSLAEKTNLTRWPLKEYQRFSPLFKMDLYRLLTAQGSVNMKKSLGSTSPSEMRRSIGSWKKRLGAAKK